MARNSSKRFGMLASGSVTRRLFTPPPCLDTAEPRQSRAAGRAERTRAEWLETLARYKRDPEGPGSPDYWSPSLDCASRDELVAIQNAKLASLTPFYRRRFDRLGLVPTDIQTVGATTQRRALDHACGAVDGCLGEY